MNKKSFIIFLFLFILLVFMQGCTKKEDSNNDLYNKREEISTDEVSIKEDDITKIAKFYPIIVDDVKIEVIAVKASDKTTRLAFNACEVCSPSGMGHYVQEGKYLVCQSCGNRFSIDEIGISKDGCNPAPIFDNEVSKENGFITISKETLSKSKELFMY
jgi:uncharacterized membrane protein